MISIHRFTYNDYSSRDFHLLCEFAFDSDEGDTETFLAREAIMSETYRGDIQRVTSYKYTEVFAPTISLIDENFGEISPDRQRKILKWLTSCNTPSFLTVYHDDSAIISYEILGAPTEIQTYKSGNGRVIGFTFVFSSIMPWALSPVYKITKDVSNPTDSIIPIILATDDATSPVYPKITINQASLTSIVTINHAMTDLDTWVDNTIYYYPTNNKYYWIDSNGTKHTSSTNDSNIEFSSVAIKNTYTDNSGNKHTFNTLIKNNIKGETVVLDGANRVISSSRANGRIFGNDFDFEWIPLYEGKNELLFVGNCTVTIEYRTVVKCGNY
jgi:hypothetical protein